MDVDPVNLIEELAATKGRFNPAAYFWIYRVLDYARARLKLEGHITGQQLLDANRKLAYDEFGPMALEVFHHWGLRRTEDIGRVVFDLVDAGILQKTEKDSLEAFHEGYDFEQAFVADYPW